MNELERINFLNEKFVGKNGLLLQIEYEFDKLIKLIEEGVIPSRKNCDEISNIETLLETLFGFKTVSLSFSEVMVNAVTFYPHSSLKTCKNIFRKPKVIKTKYNTYAYNGEEEISLITMIDTKLVTECYLNSQELVAVLLHEIGHNFYNISRPNAMKGFVKDSTMMISNIVTQPDEVASLLIGNGINEFITKLKNKGLFKNNDTKIKDKEKLKIYNENLKFMNKISRVIIDVFGSIGIIATVMKLLDTISTYGVSVFYKAMYSNPKLLLDFNLSLLSKEEEYFCDDFAGLYGYGKDLAVGLKKMTIYGKHGKLTEVASRNSVTDLIFLPFTLESMIITSHPKTINRMQEQLNYINYELNNTDLKPEHRKALQKDLKELEESIKDYQNNVKKIRMKVPFSDVINALYINLSIRRSKKEYMDNFINNLEK